MMLVTKPVDRDHARELEALTSPLFALWPDTRPKTILFDTTNAVLVAHPTYGSTPPPLCFGWVNADNPDDRLDNIHTVDAAALILTAVQTALYSRLTTVTMTDHGPIVKHRPRYTVSWDFDPEILSWRRFAVGPTPLHAFIAAAMQVAKPTHS